MIENKKNLGGGPSRNVGIMASKGKYISFLDDDDQYLPTRIEKLYNITKDHLGDKVGLVYCSCSAVNNKGEIIGEYINVYNGRPFYEQMMGCLAGASMWLVPKAVILKVGCFDNLPADEDSAAILKILDAGYSVFGTKEKLVLYLEDHTEHISGTKMSNIKGVEMYREKCRKLYDKLTSKEVSNVECSFSSKLVTYCIINNCREKAKDELANIKKHKPLSKTYFKNRIKVSFWNIYSIRLCMIKKMHR